MSEINSGFQIDQIPKYSTHVGNESKMLFFWKYVKKKISYLNVNDSKCCCCCYLPKFLLNDTFEPEETVFSSYDMPN